MRRERTCTQLWSKPKRSLHRQAVYLSPQGSSFGWPWARRRVTDRDPCPLTEAVQKRAQLALACGKKVSRVWAAYDAQDKRPQTLLRQTSAYLQGKCTAEKLDRLLKDTNFMPLMDEERYSSAPLAALAAYWGAVAALYDEPLLDSARLGCKEEQLDFYDWDAAWCAALAWAGRDENAGTGKQRVEEMKFWAWYLEQAAELMGEENYCFPKKEIKKIPGTAGSARPGAGTGGFGTFCSVYGAGRSAILRPSGIGSGICDSNHSAVDGSGCALCAAYILPSRNSGMGVNWFG